MKLRGKTALITGASKGIGAATAITLAQKGVNTIIHYNTDKKGAKKTLTTCNKYTKKNSIQQADLTKEEEIQKLFKEIKKKHKKIDILINNAGKIHKKDSTTNTEAFKQLFKTNLLGHIHITKETLQIMKKGNIIFVSSITGQPGQGRPYSAAYSAMKAALNNYMTTLAKEQAPNIHVNAIAPGKTLTTLRGTIHKKEKEKQQKRTLIKRIIKPEEIAQGILFLIQNDATCGETLTIDGGTKLKKVFWNTKR